MEKNMQKENRLSQCVYTQPKSRKRWRVLIHRIITKQQVITKQRVKNEQIKKKHACSESFVKVFKL